MIKKHIKLIVAALVLLTVLALLVWLMMKRKKEDYVPLPITLLNKEQTEHFLKSDLDGYGRSLNTINLEANGVIHHQDLLDKWSSSASSFTQEEHDKLKEACNVADYIIKSKLDDPFSAQLCTIDWQIAKSIHPYYLDGLPHTRADIIFLTDKVIALSSVETLAGLLLHEKVHLWQRKYPEEIEGWCERYNFVKVKPVDTNPLERRNPDVDGYIYFKNGKQLGVSFLSHQPKDNLDVLFEVNQDHPYEQLAYAIQRLAHKQFQ